MTIAPNANCELSSSVQLAPPVRKRGKNLWDVPPTPPHGYVAITMTISRAATASSSFCVHSRLCGRLVLPYSLIHQLHQGLTYCDVTWFETPEKGLFTSPEASSGMIRYPLYNDSFWNLPMHKSRHKQMGQTVFFTIGLSGAIHIVPLSLL